VANPTAGGHTLSGHHDSPGYDYSLAVAQVHGLDAQAQAKINGTLDQAAQQQIAQFLSDAGQAPGAPGDPNDPANRSNLACHTETKLLDARLASFKETCTTYPAGAAHPTDSVTTFNFDAGSGERLALAQLFRSGSGYLNVLSQSAIGQLDAQFHGDDDQARQGAGPAAQNFDAWDLTAGAMETTFQDYQVGPYAIGTPSVSFPYSSLRSYVLHPGPLDNR
jgi:hypothetical protein